MKYPVETSSTNVWSSVLVAPMVYGFSTTSDTASTSETTAWTIDTTRFFTPQAKSTTRCHSTCNKRALYASYAARIHVAYLEIEGEMSGQRHLGECVRRSPCGDERCQRLHSVLCSVRHPRVQQL